MLFVMGVCFLLDSPLIVFHSMCVFRLWSKCPSRCSFHMPDLCVCMAWLMSLFKCSSLLSVGSFALIMYRSSICALMFSGSRGLLGLKSSVSILFDLCTSVTSVVSVSAFSMLLVNPCQSAFL